MLKLNSSNSELGVTSIHKEKNTCFCPEKHFCTAWALFAFFHWSQLEEALDSKVILGCLRIQTRLQTQLVTQQSTWDWCFLFSKGSDWLLTGSLHCVESQTVGVRVRGQGSHQGRKLSTACTWVLFLQSDTASFPLTSIWCDYFNIRGIKGSSMWISF